MSDQPRIFISGGGSGGHLIPGLAVIEELKDRFPDAKIKMTVTGRKIEDQVLSTLPDFDIETETIPVPPLKDVLYRPWRGLPKLQNAFRKSHYLVEEEEPDLIIGLGGMTSVPLVYAGSTRMKPIVLLEQNLVPGRATSWLSRYASLICITYPETASHLRQDRQIVHTGNPLRKEFDNVDSRKTSDRKTLLVLGGSQGAASINDAIVTLVEDFPNLFKGWHIQHQTGHPTFEEYQQRYQKAKSNVSCEVTPFISSMLNAYRDADLIVCRAGATTLAEIAAVGRPALLIPYPNAVRDHQKKNAEWYINRSAARMLEQGSTETEMIECLETELELLFDDFELRDHLANSMRQTTNGNARKNVVDAISPFFG